MRDIDLYERLLGLCAPWHVEDMDFDREAGRVTVRVEASPDTQWCCPECNRPAPGYDHRSRRWRHLDTMQYYTVLQANNGPAESMSARIQHVKRQACGFRNRERFRNAIYFHWGGLELYPGTLKS